MRGGEETCLLTDCTPTWLLCYLATAAPLDVNDMQCSAMGARAGTCCRGLGRLKVSLNVSWSSTSAKIGVRSVASKAALLLAREGKVMLDWSVGTTVRSKREDKSGDGEGRVDNLESRGFRQASRGAGWFREDAADGRRFEPLFRPAAAWYVLVCMPDLTDCTLLRCFVGRSVDRTGAGGRSGRSRWGIQVECQGLRATCLSRVAGCADKLWLVRERERESQENW